MRGRLLSKLVEPRPSARSFRWSQLTSRAAPNELENTTSHHKFVQVVSARGVPSLEYGSSTSTKKHIRLEEVLKVEHDAARLEVHQA